ncbi:Hypothetical_protein [Hexamita inflata]|uniref:Hypothetical_protein n=1 Tax=Hexamita inflata TaxID=28002 RepID=A0AA86PTC5_9EUKA|nr:Hypothetical protein HINF_LOCUS28765 [Hexamita inflata]
MRPVQPKFKSEQLRAYQLKRQQIEYKSRAPRIKSAVPTTHVEPFSFMSKPQSPPASQSSLKLPTSPKSPPKKQTSMSALDKFLLAGADNPAPNYYNIKYQKQTVQATLQQQIPDLSPQRKFNQASQFKPTSPNAIATLNLHNFLLERENTIEKQTQRIKQIQQTHQQNKVQTEFKQNATETWKKVNATKIPVQIYKNERYQSPRRRQLKQDDNNQICPQTYSPNVPVKIIKEINKYERPVSKVKKPYSDEIYELPNSLKQTGVWWSESYNCDGGPKAEMKYNQFLEDVGAI